MLAPLALRILSPNLLSISNSFSAFDIGLSNTLPICCMIPEEELYISRLAGLNGKSKLSALSIISFLKFAVSAYLPCSPIIMLPSLSLLVSAGSKYLLVKPNTSAPKNLTKSEGISFIKASEKSFN